MRAAFNPWAQYRRVIRPHPAAQLHSELAAVRPQRQPCETARPLQEDRAEQDFQEMYGMSRWHGWAGWEQWVWVPYPGKGHWMDAAEDWREKEAERLFAEKRARSFAEPTDTYCYWCGILHQPQAFDDYEAAERTFAEEAIVEKWYTDLARDPELVFMIAQPERIHARV